MKINVVFAADEAFAMPLAVAASSCIRNLRSLDGVGIRIVDGGILPSSRRRVEYVIKRAAGDEAVCHKWIKGGPDLLPDLDGFIFHNTNFNETIFYRMAIPNIVDADCQCALYLDSDTVTVGNLDDFLALAEIHDFVAIRDYGINTIENRFSQEMLKNTSPATKGLYLNSGVFAANMQAWRREGWTEGLLETFENFFSLLRWPDQDCLNLFLAGKWAEAELTWNVQTGAPDRLRRLGVEEHEYLGVSYESLRQNARVLHFTGNKPWSQGYTNPDRPAWVKALEQSGWFSSVGLLIWKVKWWMALARRGISKLYHQAAGRGG